MSRRAYTEDQLVAQPAIGLFAELGWQTVSAIEDVLDTRLPRIYSPELYQQKLDLAGIMANGFRRDVPPVQLPERSL